MSDRPQEHLVRRHLRVLQKSAGGDLERLCVHCGACCYPKSEIEVEGARVPVVIKSLRCKYLAFDAAGQSRCTVYADRAEKAPWCKGLEQAIAIRAFPQDCPYVASLPEYEGPRVLDERKYREAEDKLRARLRGKPVDPWADPEAWRAFVEGGRK